MKEDFTYTSRKSKRAKRIRITVYTDARVVVTSPWNVKQEKVDELVSEKKQWILKQVERFRNSKTKTSRALSYKDYIINKEKARIFVEERIRLYNQIYNFSYNRIFIKNQKTVWGSCSAKKNLNFNFRILFLPEHLQNYLIVHEICHLREPNHSKSFWSLVAKTIPDYLKLRKELRRYELLYFEQC